MPAEYAQGVTYTVSDLWAAFEAGAREARENGGHPSDELISKSADAYCKLVHPTLEEEPEDQVVTPMPERCAGWQCNGARLEQRGGFMVCPVCHNSYGAHHAD